MTEISPTAQQLAIYDAAKNTKENLLIQALAGTGKTTTLGELAKLLPVQPTLALAFNVDAAKAMKAKLPPHFHVKTLNSLGNSALQSALRRFPEIDKQKLSKILQHHCVGFSKDQWSETREAVRMAMQAGIVPSAFANKGLLPDTPEGWTEALGYPPDDEVLEAARKALIENIEMVLQPKSVISFDDQIYMPLMFSGLWPKYPLVLCDETQDFSPMNVLQLSKVAAGRIIAVGDQRQSIYVFRGASPISISTVKALRPNWIELPLSVTFRCPKVVVERASKHAPGFEAAPNAPDGVVGDFRGRPWQWSTIEALSQPGNPVAVLCRNNAPLIALALRLLRQHKSITILGKDLAKGLTKLARKVLPKVLPQAAAIAKVKDWKTTELAKLGPESDQANSISDRAECLVALLETLPDSAGLPALLQSLFAKDSAPIILATGHKAKGLEWDTVVHLDPWRIPNKRALKQGGEELEQEYNLKYVLETRTKHTLVLADLEDFS